MTQSLAPAATRSPSPAPSAARPQRTEQVAEPPRKQAEARSARDRFAARLERENDGASRTDSRDSQASSPDDGDPAARAGLEQDRSHHGENGGEDGQRRHDPAAAQLVLAATLQGAQDASPGGPGAPASIDTTMLERMAAQIAEGWPAGGSEAASIAFPETAVAAGAHVTREPDGSVAIRVSGLDPRITALQTARLQIELANALARRRLRIRSLHFESGAPPQRARGGERGMSGSGPDAAIPRVV